MPFARHGSVAVYYESSGEGPPLVLIHANQFDRRQWMFQVASFAPDHRVVALDLRGYGRSDKPETPFSLRDMADDVVAVCEHAGIERAVFAGVSVGSGIALLLALDRPELVAALVLVGGSSGGMKDPAPFVDGFTSPDFPRFYRELFPTLFAPGFLETPVGRWVFELFTEPLPRLSGRSIAEIFRARSSCDMTGRLATLNVPTLVINGEHDMSLAAGLRTAQDIPGATHVVIPRSGHTSNIEDPAAFDAAVRAFLARERAST